MRVHRPPGARVHGKLRVIEKGQKQSRLVVRLLHVSSTSLARPLIASLCLSTESDKTNKDIQRHETRPLTMHTAHARANNMPGQHPLGAVHYAQGKHVKARLKCEEALAMMAPKVHLLL